MPKTEEALPTQQFVEIEEIKQETILLRNGGLRKVLIVTGLNFDLKSEEERGLITYSFQNFLNSLNFSVQLFVHSRKLNIENYLSQLIVRQEQESMELLKNIIGEYREFINSFVGQNAIMEKAFFVVVPYDVIDFTQAKTVTKKLFGFFSNKKINVAEEQKIHTQQNFEHNLQQINQRVDQVTNGLSQIGLRAVLLNESEITELFYNLYNPETIEKRLE